MTQQWVEEIPGLQDEPWTKVVLELTKIDDTTDLVIAWINGLTYMACKVPAMTINPYSRIVAIVTGLKKGRIIRKSWHDNNGGHYFWENAW